MRPWIVLTRLYRNLVHRERVDADLDEELRAYEAMVAAEKVRDGMSVEAAQRAAAVHVGSVESIKDGVRDARLGATLESAWRDLRYGARQLLRRPAFTATATLTLALGIGASATIASVAVGIFQARLPFEDAERLVHVLGTRLPDERPRPLSYVDYTYLRERAREVNELAATYMAPLHLTIGNTSLETTGSVSSANYFDMLRVRPVLGRFFQPGEGMTAGGDPVVVISHRLWQAQFGGSPDVVGQPLRINGVPFTIIGVAPAHVVGTDYGLPEVTLWMLTSMFRVGYKFCDAFAPDCKVVRVIGRLAAGATVQRARAELALLASQLEGEYPAANKGLGMTALPARGTSLELQQRSARTVALLGAAVVLLLAIVCANLAGLLLARNLAAAREIAVRLSIGAGRWRIVRERFMESALLGLSGGVLGIGVALLGNALVAPFLTVNYAGLATYFHLELDAAVIGLSVLVTFTTVLAFGLLPALRASRTDPGTVLKDEAQSPTRSRSRTADVLVVAQVALGAVLITDAALLVRSLRGIYAGERFDPSGVIVMRIRPALVDYDIPRGRAFQEETVRRFSNTPGVVAASPAMFVANQGNVRVSAWRPGQAPADPVNVRRYPSSVVGPDFFRVLGVRLIEGREFSADDRLGRPRVAIVNQAMAAMLWPGSQASGARIVVDGEESEVVGVVPDLEYRAGGSPAQPFVYRSYWQQSLSETWASESRMHVRVVGDPRGMIPALRRVVASIDPDMPVSEDQVLTDRLAFEFQPVRLAVTVMTGFGALAVLLSAFGLYGVLSFRVAQRTREIGVRMALGATRHEVRRLILGRGASLGAVGTLIGIGAALASVRSLQSLLYGVSSTDLPSMMLAAGTLIGVALVASYIPARRASRLDPIRAIRRD